MTIKLNIKEYLSIWIFFVFTTSFVLSNDLKGTTPAFIMSLLSFPLVLFMSKKSRLTYLYFISLLTIPYVTLQIISQILLFFINVPDFSSLILVSNDTNIYFRNSLFTQSIYLICSFLLFVFVIVFYDKERHEKYLIWSIFFFVSVGFIFWIFYVLFGYNGDFISNREYSGGLVNPGQFQPIVVGGLWMSRFVSLTGEPSMYVYSMLPYFIYMIHSEHKKTTIYLFVSLLLTLSGTFITGMLFYVISLFIFSFKRKLFLYLIIFLATTSIIFVVSSLFRDIIYEILLSKLLQESDSGLDRFISMYKHVSYFFNLPFVIWLTGMGFGFIRSPDMFSTLLVNTGAIGFVLFSMLILYPLFALGGNSKHDVGIKCGLFTTYFIMMISVSEYSYPSLWLFVGIAYPNTLLIKRLRSKRISLFGGGVSRGSYEKYAK